MLNINNWAGWIEHDGESGINPYTFDVGVKYPRGTAGVIYQDGFIWGGVVTQSHFTGNPGSYRVGGQTYVIGTQPGWIVTSGTPSSPPVAVNPNDPAVRIYRIRADWQSLTISAPEVILDAAELNNIDTSQVTAGMAQAVIDQYGLDWNNWPGNLGAPFYDLNSNGLWDAGVDEPGLASADQVIWFACNDLNAAITTNLYGSQPIGLELQVTMWGYKGSGPLAQTAFRRYRIINKSGFGIDSMFVSQWSDPDVGDNGNDLSGCDSLLSMGFGYNGDPVDILFQQYGLAPAAIGYDFMQGPIVYTGNLGDTAIFDLKKFPYYRNLPMTSFTYFAPGSIGSPTFGVYDGTLAWYNMLNGYQPVADSLTQNPYVHGSGPNAGQPTRFPVNGDPVLGIGDIDGQGTNIAPADRRMVMCSGPFAMINGDTQEVVVGIVGGISTDYLASVAQLKNNDTIVQAIYDDSIANNQSCTQGLFGDVSDDGLVNSTDALIILSYDAGLPIPQQILDRINIGFGDINEDGITNSTDALIIISFDAGIPVPFPVGDPTCLPNGGSRSQGMGQAIPKEGEYILISAAPALNQISQSMTIEVPVMIDMSKTSEKLGSYTAELEWNPQIFEFVNYSGGTTEGFEKPVVNDTEAEKGKLKFAHAYPYGADGKVNILNIQLKVIEDKASNNPISVDFSAMAAAKTFVDLLPYLQNEDIVMSLKGEEIPNAYSVVHYPNPFNPVAHIRFGLPKPSRVNIEVFNILGERVATLLDEFKPAGYHIVDFDGNNIASGIYVYRIQAGDFADVKKMILIK